MNAGGKDLNCASAAYNSECKSELHCYCDITGLAYGTRGDV
jgi:hypothetical protein